MRLRTVRPEDVDAYVAMRCDPAMTAHLGGPRSPAGMAAKVAGDVAEVAAGRAWIDMIVVDDGPDEVVAGTVTLWHDSAPESDDQPSEIGWMVLPAFQGRGLATRALRAVLDRARADGRWGVVHAYPAVDNVASNAICRSAGFTLAGPVEITFAGQRFHSNHWRIDPCA